MLKLMGKKIFTILRSKICLFKPVQYIAPFDIYILFNNKRGINLKQMNLFHNGVQKVS